MLLSAVSVLVVAQSSSEIPEGLMNNPVLCDRQILEKKWEYNEIVRQLFILFKKAYDAVRREVLYNILSLV